MRIGELLELEQLPQPRELRIVTLFLDPPFLVLPVRGDPELGLAVHRARAKLHLHALAVGTDHGGMQRLVAVLFGKGDVVLEAAGDGRHIECTRPSAA